MCDISLLTLHIHVYLYIALSIRAIRVDEMKFDMASKSVREFDVLWHYGCWKYEPDIDVKVRGF